MNKISKITIISSICLIIIIGISYAYWLISASQSGTNIVQSKCINITKSSESSAISLLNALPQTNAQGMTNTPYTITVVNTCSIDTPYVVVMDLLNINGASQSDYINSSYIKINVDGVTSLLNSNDSYSVSTGIYESRIIKRGSLQASQTVTFTIRMWLDYDTTLQMLGSANKLQTKVNVHAGQV